MNAYAYLRVSGKAQVEGDGFDRQLLACESYAKQHGLNIVTIFREEGVSGTKAMEDRPALLDLMDTLKDSGGTVIIEKLDRLARDLMVSESILADFARKSITVISVAEPDLCSNEPTRILMRQMMSAFAQYEKSMIVSKLRSSRQRMKAKLGKCEGQKAYGHTPEESAIIDRMRVLRGQGMLYTQIAAALTSEGILARSGRPWHGSSIAKIMARTTSAGLFATIAQSGVNSPQLHA